MCSDLKINVDNIKTLFLDNSEWASREQISGEFTLEEALKLDSAIQGWHLSIEEEWELLIKKFGCIYYWNDMTRYRFCEISKNYLVAIISMHPLRNGIGLTIPNGNLNIPMSLLILPRDPV